MDNQAQIPDLAELKRLADACPPAGNHHFESDEWMAVKAFRDEVVRLFGCDVGMAKALTSEIQELRKDAELTGVGMAKLAGAMCRLRAKHNDWTLPERLPDANLIWCACGDGFAANSYGAGFMDANNGVCANCDAAMGNGEQ